MVRGVLLDVDEVLTVSWAPLPGAVDTIRWLGDQNLPFRAGHQHFAAALFQLGIDRSDAVMVGDDIGSDVIGAQQAGLTGVLVRTGKFRDTDLDDKAGEPDHVIDGIGGLPELLRRL